jgi:hypothetical protein
MLPHFLFLFDYFATSDADRRGIIVLVVEIEKIVVGIANSSSSSTAVAFILSIWSHARVHIGIVDGNELTAAAF